MFKGGEKQRTTEAGRSWGVVIYLESVSDGEVEALNVNNADMFKQTMCGLLCLPGF